MNAARIDMGPEHNRRTRDRYPKYQQLRERAILDHRDRKIVQLPQTIEFRGGEELKRAQNVYSSHPDLTLMIRDKVGLEQARSVP